MNRDGLRALLERARALQPTNRAARDTTRDWVRIVMADDGTEADVYIYNEIGFWGTTAQEFTDKLGEITAKTINLHINSPGGSVFDGVAIYNALCDHPATVNVTIDALAASAASFIAQAGDNIRMGRQAMMMIHDASGVTVGNAVEHREMADLLDKLSNAIAEIYAERSGMPMQHWRQQMLAETWYSAQEAVDAMLADETTARSDDDDDDAQARLERDAFAHARANFDLTVFTYPGREAAPAPVNAGDPPEPTAPSPKPDGDPVPDNDEGGDADAERIRPAAENDAGGFDFAELFRQAADEATAPPPFEFDPGMLREAVDWHYEHAARVDVPAPPAPTPDPVSVVAPDDHDESGTLASPGEMTMGDVLRVAIDDHARNAPAVRVPASPDDAPSDHTPLDLQRIILEEATR